VGIEKTWAPLVRKRKFRTKADRDMENDLQAERIGNYLNSIDLDLTNLISEQIKEQTRNLPFSQLSISQDPVVNGETIDEMEGKGQETSSSLEDVLIQIGVSPMDHNREVVNISGEENLCGYRAILS
jgi:hypothetical protein